MSEFLHDAIEMIEKQQPDERTAVWMVGEQLKDILRDEPELAELVLQDLTNGGMTLVDCEKGIKAIADRAERESQKKRTAGAFCVTPLEAEEVIRKYFGLPERGGTLAIAKAGQLVSLDDFF